MMAVFSSPAHAATNPYSRFSACSNEFGGSWSDTSDGHRTLSTPSGAKGGDVYLLYNSATGYNCVVTIKTAYVGAPSFTNAGLLVDDGTGWHDDSGDFGYYAAVQWYARGKCVQYDGMIASPGGSPDTIAFGNRYTWGNCG
ncbi:hypothetical protein CC117_30280 [Parafrankia colletiae]|uniref:Spore-associated protein A n=2 Tax=Parafrankia colletiae TaxID=573497 RepID=A0A1S1Q651_9ACTN|nr:hypothetical protein CC117_30280 [Parafrankia colletiae]